MIVPKYRQRVFFGKRRKQIGEILRELCRQKDIGLLKGNAQPDHVHMLLSVPPKYSVAMTVGFLKALAEVAPRITRDGPALARRTAAWVIGKLDVISDEAAPALRRMLKYRLPLDRMAAAWACGDLESEDAAKLIPDLIGALSDRVPGVVTAAIFALKELGQVAEAAAPRLSEIARSSPKHRALALTALAAVAPASDVAQIRFDEALV